MEQCHYNFVEWLLKEEKQQRTIMYHGTSADHLQSILNNGLIPFPKKRVWNFEDDTSSFDTPSKSSIGGIYVTQNLTTATSSAYKAGKRKLIVVMSIHPYSTIADEDDFLRISQIPIPGLLTTPSTVARVYISQILSRKESYRKGDKFNYSDEKYVEEVKQEFIKKTINSIKIMIGELHPNLEKRIKQLLEDEGFDAALQRQTAHINPTSFKQYCWDFGDWENGCPFGPPDKIESEKRWSKFLDQITKTVKQVSYRDNSFNPTARLLKPISFSGKDKIVCIIEILPVPGTYKEQVYIHYGTPPQKLIDDWEKKEGKWRVTDKLPDHK